MKKLKKLFILSLIVGIFAGLEILAYIILEITDVLVKVRILALAFGFLTPLILIILFLLVMNYFSLRSNINNLKNENKYNLGRNNVFYNYYNFEKRVEALNKEFKNKNKKSFVIVFTASSQSVMRNLSRNDAVTIYNGHIADFLQDYFGDKKSFKYNDAVYCFYHGLFIIYLYDHEAELKKILNDVEISMYKIASDNGLRLFVQPYFGVYSIKRDDDLIIAVDNATLARNYGEKNFETVTFFSESFRRSSNINEVEEIANALNNNELVVYYQPKFNLPTKKFISSEALIRWNSPKYGLLSPAKFISKAEHGGLIHDIDMFVFSRVCEDLNEAKRKGRRMLPVSVNFSLYEFYSPKFLDDVTSILKQYNVNPSLIEIEITETTSQANTFLSISIIKKLRELGMRILMDDFGIGYSNVNNLQNMPIDKIKIDKSFIDPIAVDQKSKEIVRFLVSLSKLNGLEVIAEGVDSIEQVNILKSVKCDTIQGYYYSKPLSKMDYEKFLVSNPFERKENK